MTVQEAICARRSIRAYEATPIEPEHLRMILEAGRLAPSGCNVQPWRFIVVRDDETKRRLAAEAMTLDQNQEMCRQAPVALVCLADTGTYTQIPERMVELAEADPSAAEPTIAKRTGRIIRGYFEAMQPEERASYMALNVAIALAHMMLQATALGYGTCWMGGFDEAAARSLLGVPDGTNIVAITPLGVPAQQPPPRPRASLDEIVFIDAYGATGEI